VKYYTAHTRPDAEPVLVREGFSWGAAVFGALWLLAHRAWIAGVLVFAAEFALTRLPPAYGSGLQLVLAWAIGLFGGDLCRWSLARRGYRLAHVIAARDADAAMARLFAGVPELARSGAP
jgi:hypothetical protein